MESKIYIEKIKQPIEKNALLIIVSLFLLVILVKVVLSFNFLAPFIYMDEIIYDSLAQNLVEGKLYAKLGGSYPPGYPLFLSIPYFLSEDKNVIYHMMLIISSIVTTSIIFPSYFILKKYCSKIVSVLGALAVTTLPFLTFYSFTLMTETLFIPLFMFSVWFLLESYETNDKKWELLASLSVVYLYMTRSNGLAMMIAFVLAFIYYTIINLKSSRIQDLIVKKSFLIITFVIFLTSWTLFSTYVTDVNKPFSSPVNSHYNAGSSYNIGSVSQHIVDPLFSYDKLIVALVYLKNLIDYLYLSSYSILYIVLFLLIIFIVNRKINIKSPLAITNTYIIISSLLLVLSTLAFTLQGSGYEKILGRYIEPIIPIIVVAGIIGLNYLNDKAISFKQTNIFVLSFILFIFIVLCTIMYDNTIIIGFINMANNVALYSFTQFYDLFFGINYGFVMQMPISSILPATLMILYFLLILTCVYLSFKNKKYLTILLVIFIFSSIEFTQPIYYNAIFQSSMCNEGPIGTFLNTYTNKDTIYLVDINSDQRIELGKYGFWNKGEIKYIDAENVTDLNIYNDTINYIISSKALPYREVSNDSIYKLYKV